MQRQAKHSPHSYVFKWEKKNQTKTNPTWKGGEQADTLERTQNMTI